MVKALLRPSALSALSIACAMSLSAAAHAVTFNVNAGAGIAANTQALNAFNRAADVWSSVFSDPVEINLDVDLLSFGPDRQNVLGSASPVILQSSYELQRARLIADGADEPTNAVVNLLPTEFDATLPNNNFVLSENALATKANLKALGVNGLDDVFGATDGTITFNTDFAFDFDDSDGINAGQFDFVGIAIHEIGHQLGFISSVDFVDIFQNQINQNGAPTTPIAIAPTLLDFFRFEEPNVPTTAEEFTNLVRDLSPGGTDFMVTDLILAQMATGAFTGDGRQASHFKDNLGLGIMDPTFAAGEFGVVRDNDVLALDIIGWDVAAVAAVPLPAALPLFGSALIVLGLASRRRRKACRS